MFFLSGAVPKLPVECSFWPRHMRGADREHKHPATAEGFFVPHLEMSASDGWREMWNGQRG